MSHEITHIKDIPLSGTENGFISFAKIEKPYGENSTSVASIGVFLSKNDEEPNWKVHIPLENLNEVSSILKEISDNNK